jgi:hypothetical protein
MEKVLSAPLFAAVLAAGMLVCIELGRRLGARGEAQARDGSGEGFGRFESSVFALFGLLLAFTFSASAARFDARRWLVAEEANRIGTAYLRLDLLAAEQQPPLRDLFRRYLDSRLATYRKMSDVAAARVELSHTEQIQRAIWSRAVAGTRVTAAGVHVDAGKLLLPALNEMIDITTTRTMAARIHTPRLVFYLLLAMGLLAALLAGHAVSTRRVWSRLHVAVFVLTIGITVFLIVDLEYPRVGLLRLDQYDDVLVDLRASMR